MEQVLLRQNAQQRTKQTGEATKILPLATEPVVENIFTFRMYTWGLRLNVGILLNLVFHQRSKSEKFYAGNSKAVGLHKLTNISKFSKETIKKRMEEMYITFRCLKISKSTSDLVHTVSWLFIMDLPSTITVSQLQHYRLPDKNKNKST